MADQARWFKFWCSATSDDHLQRLAIPDRWAWVVLGAYTKLHGTRGMVTVSPTNAVLAAEMGIPVTELVTTVRRLPHVRVAENGHGDFTVTWDNWTKYQEDTTQAERQRTSRAKKRREEKREEEKRIPPLTPPTFAHANGFESTGLPHRPLEPAAPDVQAHDERQSRARQLLKHAFPDLKPSENAKES